MSKNARYNLPWPDVPVLLALTRRKSLMAAATELGIDRTTVGRKLERLEALLGVQLFERIHGKLEPTEHGRRIFSIAERAEQELGDIQSGNDDKRFGYGKVRISTSEHVASGFATQISAFTENNPEVFLEIGTSNQFTDLTKYEADIVLRIGRKPTPSLWTTDLGTVRFGLYKRADDISPIERIWTNPGNLELHSDITNAYPMAKIAAAIDGVLPTREMILSSGGAGVMPCFLGDHDDRLSLCPVQLPAANFRLFLGCLPEQRSLNRIQMTMRGLSDPIRRALLG